MKKNKIFIIVIIVILIILGIIAVHMINKILYRRSQQKQISAVISYMKNKDTYTKDKLKDLANILNKK